MTTNSTFEHARKYPRVLFTTTPWVFGLVQSRTQPETPLRLEARNVSMGGIKFFSNYKFPLFEKLQMSLFDKDSKGEPIHLNGQIVRVEETDTGQKEKIYGLAVEFKSVDGVELARLAKALPGPNPS